MTRAVAINPRSPSAKGLAELVGKITAGRARDLDDETLFMAMFSLYRAIRRTGATDPMREKLVSAWEILDAETVSRGRDRFPRLRLR
jgi:hypothetical protein